MVITKQQINVHNTNYKKNPTQTRGAASATGTATLMVYQQQGSITYWLNTIFQLPVHLLTICILDQDWFKAMELM